jgi:hypothetical protein
MTTRLPFALRAGQLLRADEVANGLACACECPGCGARVVARNQGRHRVAHFAHYRTPECAHGLQTALHLAAKELFLTHRQLQLPGMAGELPYPSRFWGQFPYNAHAYEYVLHAQGLHPPTYELPARYVSILDARLEQRTGAIVPDIVLDTEAGPLLVEIAVTHFVDEAKLAKLAALGISMLEIDLSGHARDLAGPALAQAVLHDITGKRWVYNARLTDWLTARARREQAKAVQIIEAAHARYLEKLAGERRVIEQRAQAELRARKVVTVRKIPGHVSPRQVLDCPLALRVYEGRPYANLEQDCFSCQFYKGYLNGDRSTLYCARELGTPFA